MTAIRGVPQVVWMYWEQGWDGAPPLVRECRRSWEHHNPDWDVRCLDGASRAQFDLDAWMPGGDADRPRRFRSLGRAAYNAYQRLRAHRFRPQMVGTRKLSVQARSNVLRVWLLNRYGGVWADATLWCHRPLNDWIRPCLDGGYFSFVNEQMRSRDSELLRWTSWFLIARRNHYVMQRLLAAMEEYWRRHAFAEEYFWNELLFNGLYRGDDRFRACCDAVPRIEAPRSRPGPRYFAPFTGRRLSGLTDDYRAMIDAGDCPVFKLRHRKRNPLERYDRIRYLFATIPRPGGYGRR